MKNKHLKIFIAGFVMMFLVGTIYTVFASTTVGSNLSTSGTFSATGNSTIGDASTDTLSVVAAPTFTIAPTGKITIDATAIDQTQTLGVIDLNVDAAANNVSGQDIALALQGNYKAYGQKINITTAGNDLTGSTGPIGNSVYLGGKNSATSAGLYQGYNVYTQSSTNNASSYYGFVFVADSESGGASLEGTAEAEGAFMQLSRNSDSAGGSLIGYSAELTNKGSGALDAMIGYNITMVPYTGGATISEGVRVAITHGGTIQDSFYITGTSTDGLDASDSRIVNAINIGANNIDSSGTVTFSRSTSGTITLTAADDNSDANLMIDPGGTGSLLLDIRQADLTSGSCTTGEFVLDTASTKELCFCSAGTAWTCWSATTANGPSD